jgi:hypothetical protein
MAFPEARRAAETQTPRWREMKSIPALGSTTLDLTKKSPICQAFSRKGVTITRTVNP